MAPTDHWDNDGGEVMPVMSETAWYSFFEEPEQIGWAVPKAESGGDVLGFFDMDGNFIGENVQGIESEGYLYVEAALMVTPLKGAGMMFRGTSLAQKMSAPVKAAAPVVQGGLKAHSASKIAKVAEAVMPALPKALQGGPANVRVYFGVRLHQRVYVGITTDIERRQAEHGARFVMREITTSPLTLGEARAVEQALIKRYGLQKHGGKFLNKRNEISPDRGYYNQAVAYGEAWLAKMGI